MHNDLDHLLHIHHLIHHSIDLHLSCVALLPTCIGVERCLIQHHEVRLQVVLDIWIYLYNLGSAIIDWVV